jgi:hypothetical protein
MANEFVARLSNMRRELDVNIPQYNRKVCPNGDLSGYLLPKVATGALAKTLGLVDSFIIPANLTMATGLTFKLPITDDGTNAGDLGKVVRIGVAAKLIVSGTDNTDIDVGGATEQTVDVTLSATSGVIVTGSLAIALANLDAAAVGGLVMVRVRGVGDASQFTAQGPIILIDPYVLNT